MQKNDPEKNIEDQPKVSSGWLTIIFKVLLPVVIILTGIAAASYLKKTGPTSERRPPVTLAPVVQVKELFPGNHLAMINAMGTIIPARNVELKSRVSGEIVYIHPEFIEGGFLKAGTKILQIDPVDYELALIQKEKALADAVYEYKLELGRQEVARREWELLGLEKDASAREIELALRKPHLEKAQAAITAAEAEVKKAQLDLSRVQIITPFNAIVRARHVNLGSQVTVQQTLADLVGTDTYWIQASIPVERLSWIRIPQKQGDPASTAHIQYARRFKKEGQVIRLMGDLSEEGRMARILIEVNDPLGLDQEKNHLPPLLIGDYVHVRIEGDILENVFQIPRTALRDNAFIWIMNENSNLEIKEIQPIWREVDTVLIDGGIKPGERLVITDLSAPVEGMPLQLETSEKTSIEPTKAGPVKDKS
ncbi:MAG: efflux RND transporter periplasmic adaptor subunit [Desulfobacterales bacterium]|nr:efflux RND transporter periplasmic adaptor subunit [Desulfobacterales bacterium]